MYAMACIRTNLTHADIGFNSFVGDLGKKHWQAVKRIFRYLRGT